MNNNMESPQNKLRTEDNVTRADSVTQIEIQRNDEESNDGQHRNMNNKVESQQKNVSTEVNNGQRINMNKNMEPEQNNVSTETKKLLNIFVSTET